MKAYFHCSGKMLVICQDVSATKSQMKAFCKKKKKHNANKQTTIIHKDTKDIQNQKI